MAVAYVKDTGIFTASAFGATTNGSFGTLPAVGNHVFVGSALWTSGVLGIDAVTDNQSNSYAEDKDKGATSNTTATLYSCKVATSSGTFTITIDPASASGNYMNWCAVEFSGLDATTHLDRTGEGTNTTGDALATASAANTTADGVAIGVAAIYNGDTDINIGDTPPSGYTNIAVYENADAVIGYSFVYKIYSSSETSSAQWAHDNTSQVEWAAVIGTYKAAAGAVATVFPKRRDINVSDLRASNY